MDLQFQIYLTKEDREEEKGMKIILTYPPLGEEAEKEIVDWLRQIISDPIKPSPLKYVEKLEVFHE